MLLLENKSPKPSYTNESNLRTSRLLLENKSPKPSYTNCSNLRHHRLLLENKSPKPSYTNDSKNNRKKRRSRLPLLFFLSLLLNPREPVFEEVCSCKV